MVVSFPQMIMKLPAPRGFLRLEVPVRVCVRPFPQEGSVSPFGYRTHFHTQLSLLEPGEEKNRRISQSSFQEVSDKMHVKQRQSSTLCALKENCIFLSSSLWVALAKQFLRDQRCDTAVRLSDNVY